MLPPVTYFRAAAAAAATAATAAAAAAAARACCKNHQDGPDLVDENATNLTYSQNDATP